MLIANIIYMNINDIYNNMKRAWFLHAHNHMLEHQLMNCLLESLRSAWSSLGFIWWIDDLVIVTMEIVTTNFCDLLLRHRGQVKLALVKYEEQEVLTVGCENPHSLYFFCRLQLLVPSSPAHWKQMVSLKGQISEFDDNIGWQNEAGMHVCL